MNDKEAIKEMKNWIEYEKTNKEKIIKADELIEIQETILNLIENQKAEIEKTKQNYKNLIKHITILTESLGLEEDAPIDEMYEEINKLKEEIEEKDREIIRLGRKANEYEKAINCKDCDCCICEAHINTLELRAEIEKKDKQIDLMANNLIGVVFSNNDNKEILFDNKEDVKQYFEKKAEEDKQ